MKEVDVRGLTIGRGRPKICVPLVGKNQAELLEEITDCTSLPCDLVEWRVDYFTTVTDHQAVIETAQSLRKVLKEKPLLFTFRSFREGGVTPLPDQDYFALYRALIPTKLIDLVDLELFMPTAKVTEMIALAQQHDVKVVMCNHDFAATPTQSELVERMRRMQSLGADICKIAVMPQSSRDVLALLNATEEMARTYAEVPLVTMSMGQLGKVSRVMGELIGSALTFGAAHTASAPGQVSVNELAELLELFHIE